jgi:hypothetical protein
MKFERQKFSVTRQNQWPEGKLVVEVSQGGFDYCNPGMLCCKFGRLGEGDTFDGMTPAVKAAIEVAKAWQATTDEEIGIAVGNTGGNTCPFDGEPLTPEVEAGLLAKAEAFDEGLDKCANCGDILGEERYGAFDEYDCCSSNCAENHYYSDMEEERELTPLEEAASYYSDE